MARKPTDAEVELARLRAEIRKLAIDIVDNGPLGYGLPQRLLKMIEPNPNRK